MIGFTSDQSCSQMDSGEPSNMLRDGAVSDNQEAERAVRRLYGLGRAKNKPRAGNEGVEEK